VRRSVYGKTRKDVADQLAVLIAKTKAGLPLAVESWTVERFAEHWLKHVVGPRLRSSTLSSYRETLRLHVVPTLGPVNLRVLTPTQVRKLLANKAADGLGARSVQIIHSTLRTMLSEAMREELIERNVATVVRPPSVERVEVQPWSTEEASRFLAATVDHRLHALFAVGVAIGLRKGELLALRWDDVDLDDGVLHVRQTYNDYQRWASYSVLQSRTSRAAEFRFPLPRRGCSEPTARIRLPKPLRSDRPGSTPALSSPQRSAR
jgi:integrase